MIRDAELRRDKQGLRGAKPLQDVAQELVAA
jgi:hypothetical protein